MIPFRGWNRALPWLGAVAGFCVAVVLSRTIPMAAKPGQLPGIAATLGFDPHGYFWRLVVLVACPILGGFLAAWITRAPEADPETEAVAAPNYLPRTAAILLACGATALWAVSALANRPAANLFEDGHSLLPASEYLRGELPYRDVVPGHGLISDGLLQAFGLKVFGGDYRGYHRTELLASALFWPSLCVLAFVATVSAAAAFGTLLLTFLSYATAGFSTSHSFVLDPRARCCGVSARQRSAVARLRRARSDCPSRGRRVCRVLRGSGARRAVGGARKEAPAAGTIRRRRRRLYGGGRADPRG